MIRNVLFDMGGVLIDFDPRRFAFTFCEDPEDAALLLEKVYHTPIWARMDTGELSLEQAAELMKREIPERLHPLVMRLVRDWPELAFPIPGMPELLKDLKREGYGLGLLTNAQPHQPEYWPSFPEYPALIGDRIMLSSRWHCVKPDRDFYEKAAELLELVPEECVFVDDMPQNAEGACACGYHGIRFEGDADKLRLQLRELGVRV